uniref:Uncharacterized protein n=1 Tax=Cucumis melo TaxID=3656 RepID=A0A9I9E7H2_CUCME
TPLSSSSSSKSQGCCRPCLSSLHRHLSSPLSSCSLLAQATTPRVAPLSLSHLLYVVTSGSKASELCLLQPVFVREALIVVVASPRTQLPSSRSPIRVEVVAPSILFYSMLPHQVVLFSSLKKPPSSSSHVPSCVR